MNDTPQLNAFALRMHEVCELLKIPDGHGRQAQLGKRFNKTSKAARKWLTGQGLPELELAIRIANAAGVNVNWLLQGTGPKTGTHIDADAIAVAEGIKLLPEDARKQAMAYLDYTFSNAAGWFTAERAAHYRAIVQRLGKEPPRR